MPEIECDNCNILFNKPKSHIKRTNNHYCSKECQGKAKSFLINMVDKVYNRLTVLSEVDSEKGREYLCLCECGNLTIVSQGNLRKGNTKSCGCYIKEITSTRASLLTGSKNGNWKGGITKDYQRVRNSLKYQEWRLEVYKKDNFTCQKCGCNEGGNLNAHHILSFKDWPEARIVVDNGMTLCKDCHKDYHGIYGYTNFPDGSLEEWVNE